MRENNCKWNTGQKTNFQNIQAAHAAQYQKNKQPNQKVVESPEQAFLQRRHTNGQQTYDKMLIISSNQNHNEVSPYTGQNDHQQKNLQKKNAGEDVEKSEPCRTVGGDVNWYSH